METTGQKIKQLREAQHLSQGDVEHRVGISKEYLSRLEHDKASPTIGMLEKIANALNCQIRDLLPSEEFTVREGEEIYRVGIYPGLQRIDVHNEEEADSVNKLLLVLRSTDESAKKAVIGMIDSITGLLERTKKKGKLKMEVG